MENRVGVIYKLSSPEGKVYIGQTVQNFNCRLSQHKRAAYNINDKTYNYPLYRSIRKHGWTNFSKEVLEKTSELDSKEIEYQEKYNSFDDRYGYNLYKGGKTTVEFTEKQKYEMGKSNRGKHLSKEHRDKISVAHTGKILSSATKSKLKLVNKNKGKANGIPVSRYDLNNNLIKIYSSMTSAEQDGFDHRRISLCVRGKIKTYKQSIWKYE